MSDRSLLRVAPRQHVDPTRDKGEFIVEVWRDGKIAAHVYGTREGVQIVSERIHGDRPFYIEAGPSPSVVVPLLAEGEVCPWLGSHGAIRPCPVCGEAKPA